LNKRRWLSLALLIPLAVGGWLTWTGSLFAATPVSPRENVSQTSQHSEGPQAAVFFPPTTFERKDEKLEREVRAKAICGTCSVRKPCLDYALKIREPHGIWGGLNEAERRNLI